MSVVAGQAKPLVAAGVAEEPVVVVTDLFKRFDALEAVRGVSFNVMPGEAFG